MKYALLLLLTTSATVWSFLETPKEREEFMGVLEKDPNARTFIEDLISKAGEGRALKDLGVQNYDCPGLMGPSQTEPSSVHSVRPADIKIVAALGDSLTAGNGAGASNILDVTKEYRGLAFQIGGDLQLETHVTIPNILKKYNPQVFGYSKGTGAATNWAISQLNAAIAGAQSSDLASQATNLVTNMHNHPQVNMNDWKLINIFIGGNDMCHYCEDQTAHSPANFANNIGKAIKILYDNLTKTIVNLTGMFQMQILRQEDNGQIGCQLLHTFECKCESDNGFTDQQMQAASRAFMAAEMELQNNGTFERSDFTLIIQPFLRDVDKPPFLPNGQVDHGFFAPDCFHFSPYGHAMSAKGLWNNLVQPIGFKTTNYNLSDPTVALGCPDMNCPFIRTTGNSGNCAAFFTPAK